MVQPSLKCVLCHLNKTQNLLLNQDFLGRTLLSIISNLCNNELKDNIKPTDNVCAECAMELWRSEKMLTQVKHTFARKKSTTNKAETANETDTYTFQCKSCNYNTTQLKLFKSHMLQLHGEAMSQAYACGQCEMGFSRLDFYNRHMEKQHAQQEEEGSVNKMIKFQIKMEEPKKKSKLTVTEKKPKIENGTTTTTTTNDTTTNDGSDYVFKCTECKYSSVKPKVYRRHMMVVHKYDKNNCYRCDICGKSYAIAHAFKNHMEKHRDLNTSINKQTTMISEQTLNNAKATSTPLEKKKLAKVVNSTPKPEVAPPMNVESTLKKKKKKRAAEAEQNVTVVSAKKQKKLFEKIKDDTASTTLLNSAVEETHACHLCPKVASSERKLQKHILKKHAT